MKKAPTGADPKDDPRKEIKKMQEIEEDFKFLLTLENSDNDDESVGEDAGGQVSKEKKEGKKIKVEILPESLNKLKE
jgi:hypothetical protein